MFNLVQVIYHLVQMILNLLQVIHHLVRIKHHLVQVMYHLVRIKHHLVRVMHHLVRCKHHLVQVMYHLVRCNHALDECNLEKLDFLNARNGFNCAVRRWRVESFCGVSPVLQDPRHGWVCEASPKVVS